MSFEIKRDLTESRVILGMEMGIAEAREFHAAVLPLALDANPLAVDASAVQTIHTSILQILFSLKISATHFSVHGASAEITSAFDHLGLDFLGSKAG